MDETIDHKIEDYDIVVFTDGCCYRNGKEDPRAGYGIYFHNKYKPSVSKRVTTGKQTSNRGELLAVQQTIEILDEEIKAGCNILICSDSFYAMNCSQKYGEKCSLLGWVRGKNKPIPNSDIMKLIYERIKDVSNITFKYVKAHTRRIDVFSTGNREADRLAKIGANLSILDGLCEEDIDTNDIIDDISTEIIKKVSKYKVVSKTDDTKKDRGDTIIPFGKHAGKTYSHAVEVDPHYIYYLMAQPVGNVLQLLDFIQFCIR